MYHLPVLFVCEDNAYAATTHTVTMTAGEGASARARGFGLRATTVDGNDVLAVAEATRRIIGELREGAGPRFLHVKTFRLTGHTGSDADAYRDVDEVAARWADDPIARAGRSLRELGGATSAELSGIETAAHSEMQSILKKALATSVPAAAVAFEDVHALRDGPAAF